jgi:hypothetical protein
MRWGGCGCHMHACQGWLRYVAGAETVAGGTADDGHAFTLSDDGPLYASEAAVAAAATLAPGDPGSVTTAAVRTLLEFGFQRPGSQIHLDL